MEEKREENEKHYLNLYNEFLTWVCCSLILSGVSMAHQEMSTPIVQGSNAFKYINILYINS